MGRKEREREKKKGWVSDLGRLQIGDKRPIFHSSTGVTISDHRLGETVCHQFWKLGHRGTRGLAPLPASRPRTKIKIKISLSTLPRIFSSAKRTFIGTIPRAMCSGDAERKIQTGVESGITTANLVPEPPPQSKLKLP